MKNQMIIGIILTLIIIIFIGVYWANEPARQEAARQELFMDEMTLGARTYATQCARCHGVNGEGLVGPPLTENSLPEEALTRIIERGIPHTTMTAWSAEEDGPLMKDEIRHLITFINNWDSDLLDTVREELARESGGETAAAESDKFASAGEALFTSKGCAVCHGDNALGRVIKPNESCLTCHSGDLRSLAIAPALPGHSAEEITEKVREGSKKMPSFDEDKITEDELAAIIAFIEDIPVPEISGDLEAALSEALGAVRNNEIFWANLQLEEALTAAELDVQKAQIEKVIESVADGNLAEAVEQLEAMVSGEEDGHAH